MNGQDGKTPVDQLWEATLYSQATRIRYNECQSLYNQSDRISLVTDKPYDPDTVRILSYNCNVAHAKFIKAMDCLMITLELYEKENGLG